MNYRNRILAVDDDPVLRLQLEYSLQEKYEIFCASSGHEALDVLVELARVDLILLDVKMPGMTGYECHERIKALPVCLEVPVIYLTSLTHPDEETKGLGIGAADFITKPCDPKVLLARVENRLRMAKRINVSKIASSAPAEAFTDKELIIIQCAALSMTNEEIADRMGYSTGYVRNVLSDAMQKLQIETRRDLKQFTY